MIGISTVRSNGRPAALGRDQGAVSEANLDQLRQFATNLTDDKILARVVESPLDLERMNPHNWRGSCHGGAQNAGAVREHAAGARLGVASHADPGSLSDRVDHPSRRVDSAGPGRNAAAVMLKDFGSSLDKAIARKSAARVAEAAAD